MDIGLICLCKFFETLYGYISKSYISFCHPLISQLWLSIEYDNMSSICLMSFIRQWTHHFDAIFGINLHRDRLTGFSMIFPPSHTTVSPQISKSHYFSSFLNVSIKSVTFPLQVSMLYSAGELNDSLSRSSANLLGILSYLSS